MSFEGFVCWEQRDALKLLATEALEGDEALFLATHVPFPTFEVGGSRAALVNQRDERGLLAALTHPENRHVFCVVEGEPGAGKSHMIRWLHIKWPERGKRDLVLLIQRADGSLEGTLQNLRDRLPPEYRPIFEGLSRTSQVTEEGRRRDFLNKLANSMERTYFAQPPADADWCGQRAIAQVLHHERLVDLWGAPRRILQILSGRGSSGAARDQEIARFTLHDVIQIADMSREFRSVPVAALRWLRELKRETDELKARGTASVTPDLAPADRGRFPETFGLLDALERRLNNAIQELLGSTARQLDELFKRLRRQLAAENRRLVLLLEDVTSFQGVDEKLVDALVFNADTREDTAYCDLISVLGVTPDYYRRFIETKSNYAQRITQHVRLTAAPSEGLAEFAVPFAARYLRAIRAGQQHLQQFDGEGDIFNRCENCEHAGTCLRLFGESDGVGLYPFTARAITQMFSHLRDPSNAMSLQTPRGLIQNVLNPTLHGPDALAHAAYPHEGIETRFLERRSIDNALDARIEKRPAAQREPLRRLFSWWGEPAEHEPTPFDERGNPLFCGVPRGVFEAFGLDWMGDLDAVAGSAGPTLRATDEKPDLESEIEDAGTSTNRGTKNTGVTKTQKNPATPSTPAGNWELGEAQSRIRRDQLTRWWRGGKLEDGESFWNRWLHRLIMVEIPWRRIGISPWLKATLLTESMVAIEGTKKTDRGHFVVSKSPALRDGLEAFVTLHTRPLPKTDLEHHRYRLVRLIRKLEPEITGHAWRSLNPPGGNVWSVVGLVVQIALVRAWLRGTLSPLAPLADQWVYLFDEEPSAEASPKRRVDTWLSAVQRTVMFHVELKKHLRLMVNLPGASKLVMADPSEAVSAMQQLLRGLELSQYPSTKAVRFDNFVDIALKIAEDLGDLRQIPIREGRRLFDLAAELEALSPGDSIQERARRVQDVMIEVSKAAPGAPNEAIQGWTQRHAEAQRGLFAVGNENRVARVDAFKIDRSRMKLDDFGGGAHLLDWCIRAPADDLFAVRELFRQGDVSIAKVLQYAEHLLKEAEAAGGATLQQLHTAGKRLQDTCDALVDAIREEA